jgi:hypothetical protein
MKRATLAIALEDAGEQAVSELIGLHERLELTGWQVARFIDDDSLHRSDGIIECMYLHATRPLAGLRDVRAALEQAEVLQGELEWDGSDWLIVGGMLMARPDDDDD